MRILSGLILSLFLGLMFVSLFNMAGAMNMSHDMSTISDCPFMSHQEVLCAMSINEHISMWKSLTLTLVPSTFTVVLALGAVLLIATAAPHLVRSRLLHPYPMYWRQIIETTYSYTIRPHQELFASGLLHPKLFYVTN